MTKAQSDIKGVQSDPYPPRVVRQPPPAIEANPLLRGERTWLSVRRVNEPPWSGWVVERFTTVDGTPLAVERIHGPDIYQICEARLLQEMKP